MSLRLTATLGHPAEPEPAPPSPSPRQSQSQSQSSSLFTHAQPQVSQYALGIDAARFGVVSFDSWAKLRVNISTNAIEINAGIDELVASGGTMISAGFNLARQLFADQARANATKIALLVSDGHGKAGAVAAAALLKADNVTVFAWGIGGANLAQLQLFASDPSSAVLGADLAEQLDRADLVLS